MRTDRFRDLSRALVLGLVVTVAFAAANLTIPKGRGSAKNWGFAFSHPTVLLHILSASAVVILAVMLFVGSIASRDALWVVLSALGLAFVVLAWAMGADYVTTLSAGAMTGMSLGWLGAIVAYGVGWYRTRRSATSR